MKKYFAYFKIKFLNNLQYRGPVLFGCINRIIWALLKIRLFYAFYSGNPNNNLMSFSELTSYIWLEQIFLSLFAIWYVEDDIINSITDGNVLYDFVKPIDIYWVWMSKSLASRFSTTILGCIPVLIFAILLPEPYNLSMSISSMNLLFFLISAMLSTCMLITFNMWIYIITCRTLSYVGVKNFIMPIITFLTGGIVPLQFFPNKIVDVLNFTPFAYVQNATLRIYNGNIRGMDIICVLLLQIFWIFLLILLEKIVINKILNKIIIQGG